MGPGPVRGAWGDQPDGVAGGGREVREGLGSGCLNSRIVIIIFETENLFFPARGGYSAIHYGIRRRGGAGGCGFSLFRPFRPDAGGAVEA